MSKCMKVAIIGAGGAGLCCARHLSKYPEYFDIRVLEQNDVVGGNWVYTPSSRAPTGFDQEHVHSSVYKNLKTNNPKEVMAFPDFPFPSHLPSYISHTDVLDYIQQYTSHFKLDKFIKLGTMVEQVTPIPLPKSNSYEPNIQQDGLTNGEPSIPLTNGEMGDQVHFRNWGTFRDTVKWRVTSLHVKSGQRTSDDYDAVLVCNGIFFEPYIPTFPGISKFPGHVMHSHYYREPEVYKDQHVLVIGAGLSGRDIFADISPFAKKVYVANRGPRLITTIPENVEEMMAVSKVEEDGKVYFINGEERWVDSIIIATGYQYSFPFLTEKSGIRVDGGKRVVPLYKHAFNPIHPSMVFIGINFLNEPFIHADYLIQWVILVWAGDKELPSMKDMIEDDERIYQDRLKQGIPPQIAAHCLGPIQWDLLDLIADQSGLEPLAPAIKSLSDTTTQLRYEDLLHFRERNYKVINDHKWELV